MQYFLDYQWVQSYLMYCFLWSLFHPLGCETNFFKLDLMKYVFASFCWYKFKSWNCFKNMLTWCGFLAVSIFDVKMHTRISSSTVSIPSTPFTHVYLDTIKYMNLYEKNSFAVCYAVPVRHFYLFFPTSTMWRLVMHKWNCLRNFLTKRIDIENTSLIFSVSILLY